MAPIGSYNRIMPLLKFHTHPAAIKKDISQNRQSSAAVKKVLVFITFLDARIKSKITPIRMPHATIIRKRRESFPIT